MRQRDAALWKMRLDYTNSLLATFAHCSGGSMKWAPKRDGLYAVADLVVSKCLACIADAHRSPHLIPSRKSGRSGVTSFDQRIFPGRSFFDSGKELCMACARKSSPRRD